MQVQQLIPIPSESDSKDLKKGGFIFIGMALLIEKRSPSLIKVKKNVPHKD